MTFKPMLAAKAENADIERLLARGSVLASPKIDGVRAIVRDGVLVSRALKPIRNKHTQALFGRPELEGLDGELVVGPPVGQDVMQRTTSGVMSIDGEPNVTFFVFDYHDNGAANFSWPYIDRYSEFRERCTKQPLGSFVHGLNHVELCSLDAIVEYEAMCLAEGYEGIMLRDPEARYKYGRSTIKEGGLLKVKRFEDAEAVVVGSEERMHNDNPKETDNLGHAKRSTHQAGKRPAGDLGALVCDFNGWMFAIGSGFTSAQRQELWAARDSLPGRLAKFRHFTASGVKDAPRFPVFLGFRDPSDL